MLELKKGLFVLFCLLFLFSAVTQVYADTALEDEIDSRFEIIEEQANKFDEFADNPQEVAKNETTTYLKKEWEKILIDKPVIGQILLGYKAVQKYTDPLVEFIVGLKPSLSWFFILSLIVWWILVKYYSQTYDILVNFSTFSNSTSLIISICMFAILTVMQFFQNLTAILADWIVNAIALLGNPFFQIIAVLVAYVLLGILGRYYGSISNFLLKQKKKREEGARIFRGETATKKVEAYAGALEGAFLDKKKGNFWLLIAFIVLIACAIILLIATR